jgi:amidase
VAFEGLWRHLLRDNGLEDQWAGEFDSGLLKRWSQALRKPGRKLAESAKMMSIFGRYVAEKYSGTYYGVAKNLRRWLIASYTEAFKKFDVLLMPTTPQKACRLEPKMSFKKSLEVSMGNLQNTCAFNVTGFPALSVPCGVSDGLPVGMMLVGRYFEESTLLRVSSAFEKLMSD